jgi:hypothetical protein
VLVVVLLLAWVPYGSLIHHLPWGPDAAKWLDRGALTYPRWFDWLVSERHFIGYRPVAALSFLINWLLTGHAPWAYRVTDLLLHAGSLLALVHLHQRLTGHRPLWGLVPALLVAAHPATEEVVPFVARRSYLLASLFGALGLAVVHHAAEVSGRRRGVLGGLAGLLLTAALLSNEGAYVLLPLVPLVVLHSGLPGTAVGERAAHLLVVAGPAVLGAVLALARRFAVLGGLTGGYHKRFFAFMKNGVPHWKEMPQPDPAAVADAAVRYTLLPHRVTGGEALWAPLGSWVPWMLAMGLLLMGLVPALRRPDDRGARTAGLALLWLAGALALVVVSETWFWRQATFLLPPLGILGGVWAHRAVEQLRARRWVWAVALVPLGMIWLGAVAKGPLAGGLSEGAHRARLDHAPLVHQVREALPRVPDDHLGLLVVPAPTGAAHMVRLWADRFGAPRGVRFKVLAELAPKADPRAARARIVQGRRPRLVLDGDELQWASKRMLGVALGPHPRLPLRSLAHAEEGRAVVVLGGDEVVVWVVAPGGG